MQAWMRGRGFQTVDSAKVRIPGYVPAQTKQQSTLNATSIDADVPDLLEKLFQDTISVRVLESVSTCERVIPPSELKVACDEEESNDVVTIERVAVERPRSKQLFLLVRNPIVKNCPLKHIIEICNRFITLADCIFFALNLPQKLSQLMLRRAAECRHKLQILKLSDVASNKMEYRGVPKYVILNEAEIVELEERHQVDRTIHFPTMLCDQDAASRYLGLKPGMVVRCSPTQLRYVKSGNG